MMPTFLGNHQWGQYIFVPNKSDITEANAATTCIVCTDLSALFKNNSTFNGNISHWDTRNVTTMKLMFRDASAFNQIYRNGM